MADALLDAGSMPATSGTSYTRQSSSLVESSPPSLTRGLSPLADEGESSVGGQQDAAQGSDDIDRLQDSSDAGGGEAVVPSPKPLPSLARITTTSTDTAISYSELCASEATISSAGSSNPIPGLKHFPFSYDVGSPVCSEAGLSRFGGSLLEGVTHAAQLASGSSSRAGDTSLAEWHDK